MIVVLTGGTGGAKFIDGLRQVIPPQEITLIVNTGDDLEWWGLYVSPDLDSITYVLGGLLSKERGWGVEGDTFKCLDAMRSLGAPAWFQLGDRDLATHLTRTQLLAAGKTLTEATAAIAEKLGIHSQILPMTNERVETRVQTPDGELAFQEYFVRERYRPAVRGVRFVNAEAAKPAPGVLEAISESDAVLIAPSNPITSIGPILAVPGIRKALRESDATVAAVSPIIGVSAVSGPAGALMETQGLPVSVDGIAEAYTDFLNLLIVDEADAAPAERLRAVGVEVHCTKTLMRTPEGKTALAKEVLRVTLNRTSEAKRA